jgi:hypothetical protein
MKPNVLSFRAPTDGQRLFNRIFGFLIGLGIGFPYNYLLQVRGRRTGQIYSTPINLLELNQKKYLVARVDGHNGCATPKPLENLILKRAGHT